jgi:HEAT repeat protein
MRTTVVWVLGSIKDEHAIEFLITVLSDEYSSVRAAAVWSLGKIDDRRIIDPLH